MPRNERICFIVLVYVVAKLVEVRKAFSTMHTKSKKVYYFIKWGWMESPLCFWQISRSCTSSFPTNFSLWLAMWEVHANAKKVSYWRLQSHMSCTLGNFNCMGLDWVVMIQHLLCPDWPWPLVQMNNRRKPKVFALTDLCEQGILRRDALPACLMGWWVW